MFLGRIISKSKKIDCIDFIEKVQNVDSMDNSIPTLIVGKELATSLCGKDRIKILDKKIEDNVWWCYSRTEKRSEFEESIKKFNDLIVDHLLRRIKYYNFNVFTESFSKKKRMMAYIDGDFDKYFFVTKNNIYIYSDRKKSDRIDVIGISIDELEYAGLARDRVVKRIMANRKNHVSFNDDFLSIKTKSVLNGSKIPIPFLYYASKI